MTAAVLQIQNRLIDLYMTTLYLHQQPYLCTLSSKEASIHIPQFDNATSDIINGSTAMPFSSCTSHKNLRNFLWIPRHFMFIGRQSSLVFFNQRDYFLWTNRIGFT